jgi:peroxiredoxin
MDSIAVVNNPAPNFSLPDLNGHLYHLSDFLGQIVVVNFWSAECPWAERVDRDMLALLEGWGQRVVFLNIASNANEPPDLLRQAAEERGLPLVLRDTDQAVARLYAAATTPHCFIVDQAGILRYRGAFDDVTFRQRQPKRGYVKEAIEALLANKAPELAETLPYGCAIVEI